MLLQSHAGEIHLLPALPKAWSTGHVKGLRARGGFEVEIAWENGQLTEAKIHSALGQDCTLRTAAAISVTCSGVSVETRAGGFGCNVWNRGRKNIHNLNLSLLLYR